jgi:hypothetical protein
VREFVGVRSSLDLDTELSSLKREALIFNRLAITEPDGSLPGLGQPVGETEKRIRVELEWLSAKNVIFEPEVSLDEKLLTDNEYAGSYQSERASKDKYITTTEEIRRLAASMTAASMTGEDEEKQKALLYQFRSLAAKGESEIYFNVQHMLRRVSVQLRLLESVDAYPIFPTGFLSPAISQVGKSEVVQLSLNALPMPDESTPWEQIIEYRSDPDSRSKFLALRHWMSEVARAELTPAEVEEKLEYLIDQYQKHMKLHRMKTNVGTLETVVTTGAEMLGDFFSFKWGKAAQALFSLKRRKVALLEGELTAPGNEVAYIVKARETFL